MPLDTSLYNQNPLRSMADYQGQYNKLDAQNQALQQGAIALQQANPRFQAEMALKAAQTAQENSRVPLNQARTVEAESNTSAKNLDRQIKGHSFAMQKLTGVNNPADIVQWATEANAQGAFGDGIEGQRKMVQGLTAALEAAKTPEGFAQWKQQAVQSGMTVHEQLVAKQEAEKAAEAARHNQITEANTLTTNALTNATSRANNRDTIASHERVAADRLTEDKTANRAPKPVTIENPNGDGSLIVVDANKYVPMNGSPGVIGSAGKTAPRLAAMAEAKSGVKAANDILDNLSTQYEALNDMGSIQSDSNGLISNVATGIGTTGPMQYAQKIAGTKAQTARNSIEQQRNLLLSTIKTATGMTAKEMDTDKDIQRWMKTVTDPTQSIESARTAITNLRNFIETKASSKVNGGGSPTGGGRPPLDSFNK